MIGQCQNLITFGCSWAFGFGVEPDQAFGAILSRELNVSFVNLASPGSSNSRSLLELLKYSKNNAVGNSLAVFSITTHTRECVIDHNNSLYDIRWKSNLPVKSADSVDAAYMKYFSSVPNTMFNLHKNILAIQTACRVLNIKDFYVSAWDDYDFNFPGIDKEKIYPISCARMFGYRDQHEYISNLPSRYTLACGHPNVDGHQLIAENLKKWILTSFEDDTTL
jgi:hypothetical protein